MSTTPPVPTSPDRATRALPPSFAPVMATGILSVAAAQHGLGTASAVLAGVAGGAWVALVSVGFARIVRAGPLVARALGTPAVFGLLTFVAGTDVLAARAELAGRRPLALALAALALVAWPALALPALGVWRRAGAGGRRALARGGWLNLVVATESLAIVADGAGSRRALMPVVAAVAWPLGLAFYALLAGPVLARLARSWREPSLHAPDAWIGGGALAIATLAGSVLARTDPLRPLAARLDDVTWALATLGFAALLGLEARAALARPPGWPHASRRWSMVFPIAMWSAASFALGLHRVAAAILVVAGALWLATALGVAWGAARATRRDEGAREGQMPSVTASD